MGSDMVVALGRATADGQTLFGQNSSRPAGQCQPLRLVPGRLFAAGEKLQAQYLELPQARQTFTVLGSQPNGYWGYDHGVNEHRLAVGCVPLYSTLTCRGPALMGTDLVRLVLERCQTALQGVDLLTALIERHGQGAFGGCPAAIQNDNGFLVADPAEAYVIEAAGSHWVCQQIQELRAISNTRVVRQDWDRISKGLATHAISQGWWPADGSKLDYAGALPQDPETHSSALRRWGRTTLLLQEQNGRIDLAFVRRLLTDHEDDGNSGNESLSLCRHAAGWNGSATAASLVGQLTADAGQPALAWCAFGAPCLGVYFPVFLDGELPQGFAAENGEANAAVLLGRIQRFGEQISKDRRRFAQVRETFARLQARFEQETEEFLKEAVELKRRGGLSDLQRQASLFMEHNLEQFEETLSEVTSLRPRAAVGS
jgi:secernin